MTKMEMTILHMLSEAIAESKATRAALVTFLAHQEKSDAYSEYLDSSFFDQEYQKAKHLALATALTYLKSGSDNESDVSRDQSQEQDSLHSDTTFEEVKRKMDEQSGEDEKQ